MGLEHFRWWHWVLLSIPLGWLLAYVYAAPIQPTDMRTDRETTFQRAILHAPVGSEQIPWIRNVIVYPAAPALGPKGSTMLVMPVTYEVLEPKAGGQPGEYEYIPTWFGARVPYAPRNERVTDSHNKVQGYTNGELAPGIEKTIVPDPDATLASITKQVYGKDTAEGRAALLMANPLFGKSQSVATLLATNQMNAGTEVFVPWNPDEGKTVRDWVDAAAQNYKWVHYKFAWWKVPKYCQMLWMGISVGLVGVIFPLTAGILTGAGLGGRRVQKSDYDLNRFGSGSSKAVASMPARAAELDEAGRLQLAGLNESLTASLKDGIQQAGPAPAAVPANPAAPRPAARPLATEIAAPPVAEEAQTAREYAGEFYPVVRPASDGSEPPPLPAAPKSPEAPKKP